MQTFPSLPAFVAVIPYLLHCRKIPFVPGSAFHSEQRLGLHVAHEPLLGLLRASFLLPFFFGSYLGQYICIGLRGYFVRNSYIIVLPIGGTFVAVSILGFIEKGFIVILPPVFFILRLIGVLCGVGGPVFFFLVEIVETVIIVIILIGFQFPLVHLAASFRCRLGAL